MWCLTYFWTKSLFNINVYISFSNRKSCISEPFKKHQKHCSKCILLFFQIFRITSFQLCVVKTGKSQIVEQYLNESYGTGTPRKGQIFGHKLILLNWDPEQRSNCWTYTDRMEQWPWAKVKLLDIYWSYGTGTLSKGQILYLNWSYGTGTPKKIKNQIAASTLISLNRGPRENSNCCI